MGDYRMEQAVRDDVTISVPTYGEDRWVRLFNNQKVVAKTHDKIAAIYKRLMG
jgi:hypothetical protein